MQLTAAYGAEELENTMEELMMYRDELEPRLAEAASGAEKLGYEIQVKLSSLLLFKL